MPSRAELELRAGSANVVVANYPNDSKLEQAVLYAEKQRASSGASTTIAPSDAAKAGVAGDANV